MSDKHSIMSIVTAPDVMCNQQVQAAEENNQPMMQENRHDTQNLNDSYEDESVRNKSTHSQIVVVCSDEDSFIRLGPKLVNCSYEYEKRISLKKGENIINVEEYPELQHGFFFDKFEDKPEHVEEIILKDFDTSNISVMSKMFEGCSSLKTLDLSHFDTSHVTDMSYMFHGCSSLESLDLSSFDMTKVTEVSHMFYGCNALRSLDIDVSDTSEENLITMFAWSNYEIIKNISFPHESGCKRLTELLSLQSSRDAY